MLMIIGIVPSLIFMFTVVQSYENRAVSLRISNVRNQCDILCHDLSGSDYMEDPDNSQETNSRMLQLSNIYSGRILIIDQDYRIIRDTFDLDNSKTVISPEVIEAFQGQSGSEYDQRNDMILVTFPIMVEDTDEIQGVMMVSSSTAEISATARGLQRIGFLVLGIIIIIVLILSFFISGFLVRPFSRITKSIEAVTDGYQNDQIIVTDYTETALITDAFNKLLSRMKVVDESRQEFVSNVSHELKTPLTSMKVLADSLLPQEDVSEELYKEFLRDITTEIDRENKIITDLLSLVKMDKKSADLNIARVNINDLLETILKRLRPIADERNIDLILDSFRTVEGDVDEIKFTQVITNLVENGIKYNVDDGWVRITLDADHKYFYVTVSDSGMGIPADSIDRIFERFYRVDKAHSQEIGGTGLGLSIARDAVLMHQGAIKVSSTEGEGTMFSVRIPLIYIPEGGNAS